MLGRSIHGHSTGLRSTPHGRHPSGCRRRLDSQRRSRRSLRSPVFGIHRGRSARRHPTDLRVGTRRSPRRLPGREHGRHGIDPSGSRCRRHHQRHPATGDPPAGPRRRRLPGGPIWSGWVGSQAVLLRCPPVGHRRSSRRRARSLVTDRGEPPSTNRLRRLTPSQDAFRGTPHQSAPPIDSPQRGELSEPPPTGLQPNDSPLEGESASAASWRGGSEPASTGGLFSTTCGAVNRRQGTPHQTASGRSTPPEGRVVRTPHHSAPPIDSPGGESCQNPYQTACGRLTPPQGGSDI